MWGEGMGKAASKILAGLKQARAIAKGEKPAPRVTLFNVYQRRMHAVIDLNEQIIGAPYERMVDAEFCAGPADRIVDCVVSWQSPKKGKRK